MPRRPNPAKIRAKLDTLEREFRMLSMRIKAQLKGLEKDGSALEIIVGELKILKDKIARWT